MPRNVKCTLLQRQQQDSELLPQMHFNANCSGDACTLFTLMHLLPHSPPFKTTEPSATQQKQNVRAAESYCHQESRRRRMTSLNQHAPHHPIQAQHRQIKKKHTSTLAALIGHSQDDKKSTQAA